MGGLFGGGGQSGAQKRLTDVQTQAAKLGVSEATTALPEARTTLEAPLNFFQALLSGDRSTIMSALAPEIQTLSANYDTGRKTAEEFAPRGGGRAAALEALPFQKAGQIETLVQGARSEGAIGMEQIGSLLSSLGLGEIGVGTTAATAAQQDLQAAKQNQQAQQAAAGEAIGTVIALLAT